MLGMCAARSKRVEFRGAQELMPWSLRTAYAPRSCWSSSSLRPRQASWSPLYNDII